MSAMAGADRAADVAAILLGIGAVAFRVSPPFRFRSGMMSPIYTDNRLLCSYPRERRRVIDHMAGILEEKQIRPDVLAGVSTAGIPHAAWLADLLALPMVYVRGEAKDHGKGKRVEGTLFPARSESPSARRPLAVGEPAPPPTHAVPAPNVIVVEDLVTTGGGALEAVNGVRAEGGQVRHCLAICTYGFPQAAMAFAAAAVTLLPLCDFDELVRAAERRGLLRDDERAIALDWRSDPSGWAARHGLNANA